MYLYYNNTILGLRIWEKKKFLPVTATTKRILSGPYRYGTAGLPWRVRPAEDLVRPVRVRGQRSAPSRPIHRAVPLVSLLSHHIPWHSRDRERRCCNLIHSPLLFSRYCGNKLLDHDIFCQSPFHCALQYSKGWPRPLVNFEGFVPCPRDADNYVTEHCM